MNHHKRLVFVFFVGAMMCCAAMRTFAHRVNVFAWCDERGVVHVEAKFPGGKPVFKGGVRLETADGGTLFRGVTNDSGELTFPLPETGKGSGDLRVVLEAGLGHRAEWLMKTDELIFPEKANHGKAAESENGCPPSIPVTKPEPTRPASVRRVAAENGISAWRIVAGLALIAMIFLGLWSLTKWTRNRRLT